MKRATTRAARLLVALATALLAAGFLTSCGSDGDSGSAEGAEVGVEAFAERLDDLDPDATYAVYCRSGSRSGVAVDQLVSAGFDDVAHLGGGIGAWQSAGGPVEP